MIWNQYDAATSQFTLSGGSLTATRASGSTGQWQIIRGTQSATTGKYYAEFLVTNDGTTGGSNGQWAVGVTPITGAINAQAVNAAVPGQTNNGCSYLPWTGLVINNGSTTTIQASTTGGITVCMAVDLGNTEIWWRIGSGNWNNSGTANPATNTGGISIAGMVGNGLLPMFGAANAATATTAAFLSTAWSQTAPSGFTQWPTDPALPAAYMNPADMAAGVSPYNSDLWLASNNNSTSSIWRSIRSTPSFSASGKWYVEITVQNTFAGNMLAGFMNASANMTAGTSTGYPGYDTNGVGYQSSGNTLYNNANVVSGSSWSAGDVVGLALDGVNHKLWARTNTSGWFNATTATQNPATNTGGAACSGVFGSGNIMVGVGFFNPALAVTVNITGPFTNTPPSGFVSPSSISSSVTLTGVASASQHGSVIADVQPTLTHTSITNPITVTSPSDVTSAPLNIPAFDSTEGTLKSVIVIEDLNMNYSGTLVGSASFTATTVSALFETKLSIVGGPTVLDGSPVIDLTAGSTVVVSGTTPSPFTIPVDRRISHSYTTGLSSWQMSGGGNLGGATTTVTTKPTFPGITVNLSAPIDFTLDVTYDYDAGSSGVFATTALGTVTTNITETVGLTGVATTGAIGTVAIDVAAELVGVAGVPIVGIPGFSPGLPIYGVTMLSGVGILQTMSGPNLTNVPINGSATVVNVGQISFLNEVALSGLAAIGQVGEIRSGTVATGLSMGNLQVVTIPSQETDSNVTLRWSDTAGAAWENPVERSLGLVGQYLTNLQWRRLGLARNRVFELSWACNAPTCLQGLYLQFEVAAT